MRPGQSLSQLTAQLLTQLEGQFQKQRPDLVLAHGDTTTCFATAISSFYHQIPFFHVEAGLRTHRLNSPFPEEFNRQSIAPIARHHFAPTDLEKENLLQDGISSHAITVTGSTVHDAVRRIQENSQHLDTGIAALESDRPLVVVTLHRREANHSLEKTLQALKESAVRNPEALFVCPVHPNPSVQKAFHTHMQGLSNIVLTQPMDYPRFVGLLLRSQLVITDSGGVQEEASFLGKKVLLARHETERQDGLQSGLVKMVGLEPESILSAIRTELSSVSATGASKETFSQKQSASDMIAQEVLRVVG